MSGRITAKKRVQTSTNKVYLMKWDMSISVFGMRKVKAVGFFGLLFLDLKNSYHSAVMGITVKIPRVQLCENLWFDAVFRCVSLQTTAEKLYICLLV